MRALRLESWQSEPVVVDVPQPEPGPGQVVVRVAAAGACHSDLHVMDLPAGLLPVSVPFTLGHECTGTVAAIGAGVTTWSEGDRVAVYGPWGCGACWRCARGEENYCVRAAALGLAPAGLGSDGAMAEYMLVPDQRLLVPLGDLDPIAAAPLTDAGLTPYHALRRSLGLLVPGSSVVVIGVGGLGHLAIQLVKALSPARVVAVDVDAAKLELASIVGADVMLLGEPDASGAVREATGGEGAALVLDLVGSDASMALAAAVAGVGSHVTIVGLAGGTLPLSLLTVPWECSVSIPYWGSRSELVEVLALAQAGQLDVHVEPFPLEDGPAVYRMLREGRITGRAVLVPGS